MFSASDLADWTVYLVRADGSYSVHGVCDLNLDTFLANAKSVLLPGEHIELFQAD